MSDYYTCHGIEWDRSEKCMMCDVIDATQARIVKAIQHEADTWQRPTGGFSYRKALRELADKIQMSTDRDDHLAVKPANQVDTCIACNNPSASILAHQTGIQYGHMMERLRITSWVEAHKPTCNTDFYNGNGCDCVVPYHELVDQINGLAK